MSYDISIDPPRCSACGVQPASWLGNPTYNLREMFVAAFGGNGIKDFNGKTAREILPVLEAGIADMRLRPYHYEQFNPPNQWGSYAGILPVLDEMLEFCRQHPDALVSV